MSQTLFKLTAFPQGLWQIVWIGDVKFIRNIRRVFQPVVTVTLQSLKEANKFVEVNIAIGQMFKLVLGSIWEDGIEQLNQPVGHREVFSLTTYQARFIKAGSSLSEQDENKFWLPFSLHYKHKHHTESWCTLISLDTVDVIIPCAELLRFYFGSSSNLLKQIVRSHFNPFALWQDFDFDKDTGHLKITLAEGISGASAADIGRIIIDKTAFNAVSQVSKTLTSSIANREKAYIKMPFPFIGKSKLQVLGQWLHTVGLKDRFVVSQVESCSHRLPFLSLRYVSYGSLKNGLESQDQNSNTHQENNKPAIIKNTTKVDKLTNEEPNLDRQRKTLGLNTKVQFPDLLTKQVVRVTPQRTDMIMIGGSESNGYGSTGDGEGSCSDIAKVDICLESPFEPIGDKPLKSPMPEWNKYFEFLLQLSKEPWIARIEFPRLDSKQVEKHYAQLPNFVDENGEILQLSSVGSEKQNYVSICRVYLSNTYFFHLISFDPELLTKQNCFFETSDNKLTWISIFMYLKYSDKLKCQKFSYDKYQTLELIMQLKQFVCNYLA